VIFTAPSSRKSPRRGLRDSTRNSSTTAAADVVPEPTIAELRALTIATAVPFLGFGFMDNFILIIAGDAIDTSLGVMLGLSTMCAAAIGNIISDVAGIMLGAAIEDWCATNLKLPVPQLTAAQRNLRSVRFANQW
jgi:tRNA-specific adenosine deaminase 1